MARYINISHGQVPVTNDTYITKQFNVYLVRVDNYIIPVCILYLETNMNNNSL